LFILPLILAAGTLAQPFQLPTANHGLYEAGGEEKFFVGTVGKPWQSGGFGCVRSEGTQFHEGLDIRCLERDKQGEPLDAVVATADGVVAYINPKAGLSNYGKYIVLRHQIDGLEIYSLYAHLREIRAGLQGGQIVGRGEPIAIMGRTANTRQQIAKDRAHLHFELDLLLNERFAAWYNKFQAGERNDHGAWNGQNLLGFDARAVLLAQRAENENFSLLHYLQQQPELCRVLVHGQCPFARRYSLLVQSNPTAEKEGIAGYEIALAFNGLPIQFIPRAASEFKTRRKVELLSVNEAEYHKRPCGHIVVKKGARWELSNHGVILMELLTY
jgi:murein DD-endopeptidase MepM/ murein hydrolase activator NlpD